MASGGRGLARRTAASPLVIHFDFEGDQLESEPLEGRITRGEGGASLRVSADTSRGGRQSLKFTDATEQRYTWTPHIHYRRTYEEGSIRLAWDMLNCADAPARFFIEVRQMDPGSPYRVGPTVTVTPDGAVHAGDQAVGTIPLGEWIHVTIDMELGPEAPGSYRLELEQPGGAPVVREIPYRDEAFRRIDWLGISSTSLAASVFYIDNLQMGAEEELAQPPRRRPPAGPEARQRPTEPPNDQQLVGHWTFSEDDGFVVRDESGHGNQGELWAELVTGEFGTALRCDAIHSHVRIQDHPSLHFGAGDFSIDLWICPTKLASHSSDPRRRFLSKSDHPRTWWVMDITPAGRIRLEMTDANRVGRVSRTEAGIPENEWSHLAVVVDRDEGQVRFYLNGRLDSAHDLPADFTGALSVPADLTLGSTWQPFIGLLDQVRIFRRQLDEAELRAAFAGERDRRTCSEYRVVK